MQPFQELSTALLMFKAQEKGSKLISINMFNVLYIQSANVCQSFLIFLIMLHKGILGSSSRTLMQSGKTLQVS